jgi:plasmid stabilization system protein ParE
MTGYGFHPEARSDLDEIWEFIRADNLDAADRTIAEIFAAIRGLIPFPIRATNARTSLRGPCDSFFENLIAYAPDEKPLWVVAVMHGRRSPRVMAAILRGRK